MYSLPSSAFGLSSTLFDGECQRLMMDVTWSNTTGTISSTNPFKTHYLWSVVKETRHLRWRNNKCSFLVILLWLNFRIQFAWAMLHSPHVYLFVDICVCTKWGVLRTLCFQMFRWIHVSLYINLPFLNSPIVLQVACVRLLTFVHEY